jgi:DUF4097 and DUF4098 domain-containing protein YvlB
MVQMTRTQIALALVATTLVATPALAQDTWSWNKTVAAGRTLEIKGINGTISATPASGSEAQVVAKKKARKSDTDDVTFKVIEHAGGVTICAMYPTPRGKQENECEAGGKGRMNSSNNDVTTDFEVRVPRGVRFTGRTVNGAVSATGLTADAELYTVNGGVRVETTGLARASTVNGSVDVTMGRANWTGDLDFSTVNGSIEVTMPDDVDAVVSASMVNGSFTSDWPLTVKGKWGPKRVNGTIGNGGRELGLSTVNGNIELRKNN